MVSFVPALSTSNNNEAENTNLTYAQHFSVTSGSVKQYAKATDL